MNFDLSEEQEMFRASVERFSAPIDVEARRKLRLSPTGYDRQRWQELAELGLVALAASEEDGGLGGSPVDLSLVFEAIGKANSPDPLLEHGALPALLLKGHEALENALSGDRIATFAWAERSQRYSLAPKGLVAEASGDGYTLTGEKTFVMGALLADIFIVTARLDGETALFVVPSDAPGLETRAYRLTDGSIAGELRLTRVGVEGTARLAQDDTSLAHAVSTIRLCAAAEMVGLGQRLLDDTLAFVKEREQFGVAIGTFQALQHRLVEAYARLEQSRSMLYRAALSDPSDRMSWARATAGAKAFIAENVDAIGREAVQMHGGMGITDELAIGHAMKRVIVLSRLFGDTDSALAEYAEAA
ncbi:MAG: acyl-CoA dehydrogenase family protein [Pseudomonadota bacterium]